VRLIKIDSADQLFSRLWCYHKEEEFLLKLLSFRPLPKQRHEQKPQRHQQEKP
jgi:hypothetical protein